MRKKIFICDLCKKEVENPKGLDVPVQIQVRIKFGDYPNTTSDYPAIDVEWCRECVMKKGICNPIIDKDKCVAPEVQLTTTDKLIILLEELGFKRED